MPEPLDLKLSFSGTIPGEQIVVALFNYLVQTRATMSQETRDAWDKRGIEAWDRWVDFWKTIGVIK